VVIGYSRILFAAFDYRTYIISIAIILICAIFLFPFMMIPAGIIFGWPIIFIELIILQIIIILIIRIIFSIRFKCKAADIILHPLAIIYLIAIAVRSVLNVRVGMGLKWKGRVYDVSEEDNLRLVNDNYK